MRPASGQKWWRSVLLYTVFLPAVWIVVAFVFATETCVTMPTSLQVAATMAFRDWFPWLLLSPLAVALARRFRPQRSIWKFSLVVHLAACLLCALAYQGISQFVYYKTGIVSFSVAPISTVTAPAGTAVPTVRIAPYGQLRPLPSRVMPGDTNRIFIITNVANALISPSNFIPGTLRSVRPFSSWQRFLQMAMLKTQFVVPIYWCIVCLCWLANHFQETEKRERRVLELEAQLVNANLQALKMQVQPHFLFNSLNAISSLIPKNPKMADDMVVLLSQFLRTTLEVSSQREIALDAELKFVDNYLKIQQMRFGARLQIRQEIEPETRDALVPPLILQPIVENAIRHGIEARETGGTVILRAARIGETLRLEITDDGVGLKGGALGGLGIGLSNTKARLETLYGDRHELKLTAARPTGTRVTIEIPFRHSAAEAKT